MAVNISGLDIGDHLKVADIKAIDGLTLLDSGEAVVASISAPRATAARTETEETEKQAEPEVVGKKGAKSES